VVTRAPVAPQVLGSTPRESEFLRILTAFVLSVVDDVPGQRGAYGKLPMWRKKEHGLREI
jgi:hypothetical protein